MKRYLVALEGALIWNLHFTEWTEVRADSAEEAAAWHAARLYHNRYPADGNQGATLPLADVYPFEVDLWLPSVNGSAGPYVVKEAGQEDSEAIAVLVDVCFVLVGRQIPRTQWSIADLRPSGKPER